MAEVATTKLFESDKIILWEMVLAPGENTGLHTHHYDYMFYATQGSTIEVQDEHGQYIDEFTIKEGEALEFKLEGDQLICTNGSGLAFPATHQGINRGDQAYKEILVEYKP